MSDLDKLRMDRNLLLQDSDWIVAKSSEAGVVVPDKWKTYRQELRDITKTFSSMNDKGFKFPDKP